MWWNNVIFQCGVGYKIYIYLFRTPGTANTSTFEEKQKKPLLSMQHCTHQFTDKVKICTLKAALITAQCVDYPLDVKSISACSHLLNLRSFLHSIKSLMEPACILMSTPLFTLLILGDTLSFIGTLSNFRIVHGMKVWKGTIERQ